MIVLDTSVILEAMKPSAEPVVIEWLNRQPAETLFLTSITLAELLSGIAVRPRSKSRNALVSRLDGLLELFEERILPFGTKAAQCYAANAPSRTMEQVSPAPEGYIAAIAKATGFSVATRHAAAFDNAGVLTINPWISH